MIPEDQINISKLWFPLNKLNSLFEFEHKLWWLQKTIGPSVLNISSSMYVPGYFLRDTVNYSFRSGDFHYIGTFIARHQRNRYFHTIV